MMILQNFVTFFTLVKRHPWIFLTWSLLGQCYDLCIRSDAIRAAKITNSELEDEEAVRDDDDDERFSEIVEEGYDSDDHQMTMEAKEPVKA